MSDSFQNEVPRSRVNISLDLETGGAGVKKELPMKLLVLGDFSNGQGDGDISERERININSSNIEQVMTNLAPKMNFSVPNRIKDDGGEIAINLTATNFRSFEPEHVVSQIPELRELLSMRNLLKDLKSNLLDNSSFRKEVERILNSQPDMDSLKTELKSLIAEQANKESEE